MAEKGIREFDAKRMIAKGLGDFTGNGLKLSTKQVLVTPETDIESLSGEHPWLESEKLVAKPDQLFGKRGKNNLLLVGKDWKDVKTWIKERMNKEVTITQTTGETTGVLTHFLVEKFFPHEEEYYLAITTGRESDTIHFSTKGGVDIEEVWNSVSTLEIPILSSIDEMDVAGFLPEELGDKSKEMEEFIKALYKMAVDYHFTYLEFNPITFVDGTIVPLDTVAKLDDYASYQCAEKWNGVTFPSSFGLKGTKEEQYVNELDERTGASLKLTVLNPEGRVWTLVAGGGASVIFADTVADLGFAGELANYGEYSGNPSRELTYAYTKTILKLMTEKKDSEGKPKFLIIGGGIANFTDVAKTFTGIIDAIEEYSDALKKTDVKIYVRRGGPNYKEGLANMRKMGKKLNLPVEVYGPETHMTEIVSMALQGKEV
ncbi:MAG TPA: ATP citrate lyase citrate-binding domain-containing protein [Candidatus Krumholzibacteriaceae bacterium]|nr:ATP citrate lyase citrate-binding domain-containing protein [Candidatus Krumholzibacteriaceae bacterium]